MLPFSRGLGMETRLGETQAPVQAVDVSLLLSLAVFLDDLSCWPSLPVRFAGSPVACVLFPAFVFFLCLKSIVLSEPLVFSAFFSLFLQPGPRTDRSSRPLSCLLAPVRFFGFPPVALRTPAAFSRPIVSWFLMSACPSFYFTEKKVVLGSSSSCRGIPLSQQGLSLCVFVFFFTFLLLSSFFLHYFY